MTPNSRVIGHGVCGPTSGVYVRLYALVPILDLRACRMYRPPVVARRLFARAGVLVALSAGSSFVASAEAASAASGSQRRTAARATKAFGQGLHRRYGGFHGPWTCPVGQVYGYQVSCQAEFRQSGIWYRVGTTGHVHASGVSLSTFGEVSWVRRWSPFTHHLIAGFGATGVAAVNPPDEDRSFIGGGIYYDWNQHRKSAVVDGYDGQGLGLGRFYRFRCDLHRSTITCSNSFGDAIRYRPGG